MSQNGQTATISMVVSTLGRSDARIATPDLACAGSGGNFKSVADAMFIAVLATSLEAR